MSDSTPGRNPFASKRALLVPAWMGLTAVLLLAGCGADLFMPVTGTVYGTVRLPDGSPAAGARVLVEGTGLEARTRADGRFVINGVPAVVPGRIGITYDVRGELDVQGVAHGFLVPHFKVKEQQSYSIGSVTLRPAGAIRGRVQLEGDPDASGIRVRLDGMSLETVTRASGDFLLERVPPHDHYRVVCEHEGYAPTSLSGVAVSSGGVTDITPAILPRLP